MVERAGRRSIERPISLQAFVLDRALDGGGELCEVVEDLVPTVLALESRQYDLLRPAIDEAVIKGDQRRRLHHCRAHHRAQPTPLLPQEDKAAMANRGDIFFAGGARQMGAEFRRPKRPNFAPIVDSHGR